VELRRAQDVDGDRACERSLLVGELGRAVTGGETVGADDGHDDDPLHSRSRANLLEVPGRRGEEPRGLVLGGGRAGRGVDDRLDACQRFGKPLARDHVHAGGAGHRDDLVPPGLEHVDGVTADPSRCSSYCDLHAFAPCRDVRIPGRTGDKEIDSGRA